MALVNSKSKNHNLLGLFDVVVCCSDSNVYISVLFLFPLFTANGPVGHMQLMEPCRHEHIHMCTVVRPDAGDWGSHRVRVGALFISKKLLF
jgi:hypothetical protein